MEPIKSITKKTSYTHLKESERYKIEVYREEKISMSEISRKLGRSRSTIYREVKRGSVVWRRTDLNTEVRYRADVALRDYREKGHNKERGLKIGSDRLLEAHIRKKILEDRYSPDALIGEIKDTGLVFEGMICTKTLYNYIDAGIFKGISNDNLWERGKRKKKPYHHIRRVSRTNRKGRSIEERPEHINDRHEYGHWEGDCVKGPQGKTATLLTFTERKSRQEIIIKMAHGTQSAVQQALDSLENKFKEHFRSLFKSITFDNGVEFLDMKALETSARDPQKQRTIVYYAHAYASWERGSNEVHNKMIRRFIKKGVDIKSISEEEIKSIEKWMNNYPRKILGYKTANQITNQYLQDNRLSGLQSVPL